MGILPKFRDGDPDGVEPYAKEFLDLRTHDADRIDRMRVYREEGAYARTQQLRVTPTHNDDYGRDSRRSPQDSWRHNIPLPFGKALNVKHSYRIAGKLPDVIVDRRDESPEERYRSDTMEKIVWAIMRASRGQTEIASAAWDGSELGASCFDIYFDVKRSIPIFRACDPIGVVVVPGVDDPHEFQRVYKSWDVPLVSMQNEYNGAKLANGATVNVLGIDADTMVGGVQVVTIAQVTDGEKTVRFLPRSGIKLYEHAHKYGFVPYVVIPNIGPARDVWGWADYEFIRSISHYMGQLFSREADILRAVANGTYVDRGTGQAPEVVKQALSEGGVVPSKATGTLEPVNPPQVPAFTEDHARRGMEMFKMLGFAPDASWGLGRYTSGAEHGLSLQPFVEFTAMKQLNWEAGLGRLFSMAYRMLETKLVGSGTYRGSKPASGNRRLPFTFQLGSDLAPLEQPGAGGEGLDDLGADMVELPRTPKELFDGDYEARFIWNNRIDPDDPSYVLSELNKFQHGAQSLETTLERLGFEAPQDEIRRIEKEAELYPWLNQGMIALIRAQLSQSNQGDGGGQPADPTGDLSGATQTAMPGPGGALGADAGAQGLGSGATGPLYGGA